MNDASAATFELLRALNVAAAPGSVAGYVSAHPAYPSLAAIVDGLAEFGVRATARRISADGLGSTPTPALVHVREDGGGSGAFWLISDHIDGRFECRLPSGESRSVPDDELAARYLGIVVSGVAESFAGERYAARNALGDRLRASLPLAWCALLLASLAACGAAASRVPAPLLGPVVGMSLLGFAGFGLALHLSLQERLGGSGLLGRLCPTGKTFNCASVVGSRGAYVAEVVALADIGAAFFAAQIASGVAAALAGVSLAFLSVFAWLAIVLIPVIVYSLVEQAVVLRRFCTLCLLLDGVLCAELGLSAQASRFHVGAVAGLPARDAVLLAASAVCGALAYAVVRPLVVPAFAAPGLHAELESLRGLPEVFAAGLARTAVVATDVPGKLLEGDAAAPLELLVVSHPFCAACADAHRAARRLVEAFPELVRAATIFSVSDADGPARGAAASLLSGARDAGDWYARVNENVDEWIRRGDGARSLAPEQAALLAAQRAFAAREGIAGTPAIFIAGRRLPPGFGLHHLRFYLRAEQRRLRASDPARELHRAGVRGNATSA